MNLQEELKQLGHRSDTTSGEIICFIFELCGDIKKFVKLCKGTQQSIRKDTACYL